ncbi:MAG: pilus assembly protein [Hyphomicrobiales bacterium]|nr:pilus assembly protein [Hyphomicrobiales bacterium]
MCFQYRVCFMSPKFHTPCLSLALLAAIALAAPASANEGTPITVKVNMARILRINSPAATVVIGNPGVADVTIQDPQTLVLTGKTYGQTNIIVLDSVGNPIADTLVEVVQSQADLVTVFNAGARTTVACAPACAPSIIVGDDPNYTEAMVKSLGLVQGAAQ